MRKYETMNGTMNRIRSSNEAAPASREVLVGRVRKLEKRIAELEQAVRAPSEEIERLGDSTRHKAQLGEADSPAD